MPAATCAPRRRAGLLIAGSWLDREDFAGRFVTVAASPGSGTAVAVIDWAAVAAALGGGLPCSGGERRMLRLAASLAAGIPAGLRDAAGGPDGRNARLAAGPCCMPPGTGTCRDGRGRPW